MMSRRRFCKILASTCVLMGTGEWVLSLHHLQATVRSLPVLLYHRINYTKGYLSLTPEHFESHLAYLQAEGFESITLQQFYDFLSEDDYDTASSLPEKPVLITFDDGYLDNYEYAYPLLKKYDMTATFFIISGFHDRPERLKDKNIREMNRSGMSFGSHTVHHVLLSETPLPDIRKELSESKGWLEDIIGREVLSLAYPRGGFNDLVLEQATELGYRLGFTTKPNRCDLSTDPLQVNRIPIFSYDHSLGPVLKRYGSSS